MPYGMKNESPEDTAWMEKCEQSVKKENPSYSRGRCIAICKVTLQKKKAK